VDSSEPAGKGFIVTSAVSPENSQKFRRKVLPGSGCNQMMKHIKLSGKKNANRVINVNEGDFTMGNDQDSKLRGETVLVYSPRFRLDKTPPGRTSEN